MSKGLEFSFEADPFVTVDIFTEAEDEKEVSMLSNGNKEIYQKAEELHSFLKTYFDDIKEELTKCDVYLDYILKVPDMLSSCFLTSSCLTNDRSEKEMKHKNLKAAEICLKIILTYLECPQTFDATKSIIQTSISVLHQAYSHCKDSEVFYGELFEEFTNELGSFYKNVQDVQKAILGRLDDLLNNDSYDMENDSASIVLVCHGIGQLCELVTTLDQNIALIFWKIFLKLISKYKDVVLEKLEVDVFLLPLIFNIEDIVFQCLDCLKSNEQISESEIKLCIMELSLLKKIVQIFSGNFKQKLATHLRNLSLQIFSLLIVSHSQTVAESKDLSVIKILLKTVKHAIIPFFSDGMFFASTLHCSQKDISPDSQVPLILLKLTAVDSLKNYSEHFQLFQKSEVLVKIFSTLKENTPDDDFKLVCLKIPTSLVREASCEVPELLTIYQHCYMCLAEYSKLFLNCPGSAVLFEKSLLNVFTSSSDVVSLLISDVLMYYLRSGSIEDTFKNCNTLAKIIKQEQGSRIDQLFVRMLKLLPDDYKIQLFEENENLYSLLGLNNKVSRFNMPMLKNPSLMTDIYHERIISKICNLNNPVSTDYQKMIEKTCSILEFNASYVDNLTSLELLKFLEFASIMIKSDIFEVHMAVISFLRAFIGKNLPKYDKEFDSLTSAIARLLSDVMQSKNYIIRLEAFNVYFKLAESTPHPEIVKKTVMNCPGLVPSIKSYAEKIPSNGFLKEETKNTVYQKQLAEFQINDRFRQHFYDTSKQLLSDLFL